ncbi:unnamed protein product [Sphagnum troendelagicum]
MSAPRPTERERSQQCFCGEASTMGTRGEYGFVGTPFDEHLSVKDDVMADEQPLPRKIEQLAGIDRQLQRDCLQEVLTRLGYGAGIPFCTS